MGKLGKPAHFYVLSTVTLNSVKVERLLKLVFNVLATGPVLSVPILYLRTACRFNIGPRLGGRILDNLGCVSLRLVGH